MGLVLMLSVPKALWCGPEIRVTEAQDLVQLKRLVTAAQHVTITNLVQLNRALREQFKIVITDTASVVQLNRARGK